MSVPWPYPKPLPPKPTPEEEARTTFRIRINRVKKECIRLEELIENATLVEALSLKDLKRLDKAVTLIKVGLKIAKKATKEDNKCDLVPASQKVQPTSARSVPS